MNSIANAVISFFELLEAEGRNLRKKTVAAAENLMLVFFAFALVFVGTIVMSYALCLWLSEHIGEIGAVFTVAVLLLALGGMMFVKARAGAENGDKTEKEEGKATEEMTSLRCEEEAYGKK